MIEMIEMIENENNSIPHSCICSWSKTLIAVSKFCKRQLMSHICDFSESIVF